jgi:hypothetical protein
VAIFGTGNGPEDWTAAEQVIGGKTVLIGLRGKQRFPPAGIYNYNGKGGYTFAVGCDDPTCPTDGITPRWTMEWTINSEVECNTSPCSRSLNDFNYEFYQDIDRKYVTNFVPVYGAKNGDVINNVRYDSPGSFRLCYDHSFGTSANLISTCEEVACDPPVTEASNIHWNPQCCPKLVETSLDNSS